MSPSRRDFLRASVAGSVAWALRAGIPAVVAGRAGRPSPAHGADETVLVVVQLAGGNDGLNTVIPYADDAYARSRPTLRFRPDEVLKINSELGFHPEMAGFMKLYEEGYLSVVQGVGHADSSRNHDAAMRDWHTAAPGRPHCQTGWLGRAADQLYVKTAGGVPAAFVGHIRPPKAINAERALVPAIRQFEDWALAPDALPEQRRALGRMVTDTARIDRTPGSGSPAELVQRRMLHGCATGRRVHELLGDRSPTTDLHYPPFGLAQALKTVSRALRAELGIRIFMVVLGGSGFGGFDNHANQRGNHGSLLRELSESVRAFVYDLKQARLVDRVLLMTFSEFGRTLAENGRRGTGHGAAAPVFIAGGRLKGGLVGPRPSLTDLDQGALRFHIDYRRLYATMLERWLGMDSKVVLGERFQPLDILKA